MAQVSRVYQDFEPTTEWVRDAEYDTLFVYLPGFKKEQMKVQITSSPTLRIFGERSVGDNKWSRFHKELRIPSNYDTSKISAKYEGGILKIKHAKITKPETKPKANANSSAETTNDQLQAQNKGQDDQPTQDVPPKINNLGSNDAANKIASAESENMPDKEKEPRDANHGIKNNDVNSIPGKNLDNQKSERLVESAGKITSTDYKHEMSSSGKGKLGCYKQVFGVLVTEMKKPRKSKYLVVAAALLVLVLGLYVKNAVRSEGLEN